MDYNTRCKQLIPKSTDDVFNQADLARKLLVLNYEITESTSSKDAVSFILNDDWNRYADSTSDAEIYDEIIKRSIVTNKSAQWKTNIGTFAKDTPKQLNLDDQFAMFSEVFNINPGYVPPKTSNTVNNRIDTSKSIVNNKIDTNKSIVNNKIDTNKSIANNKIDTNKSIANNRIDTNSCSVFKTARDELNLQNIKKYGKSAAVVESAPKRRRLGNTRIYVGNKFVSPMLSNNESGGEDSKSQEWTEEIALEPLKNIDPKMVELIRSEIMDIGTSIEWNDIAGLEFAKTAIQEAVVWPMLRPDIFTGLRRPPKGILLFGPPGTGKTLIGKCVASQSKSTFFSISASSLTSKWIGDGEKMVRALFAVARCHQPAVCISGTLVDFNNVILQPNIHHNSMWTYNVIFIDEIDSLLSQRSDNEHESSRRMKTEFLVQLDGATTDNEERLLLIGATNRPQELDEAARRRFVKRLYIPLPELQGRFQLVSKLMSTEKHNMNENDMQNIARLSDGYSGADMRNLCADASMEPIRSIDIAHMQSIQAQEVRPVSMDDFKKSLSRVRPSVSPNDLDQYLVWDKTYGSGLC